MKKLLPLVLIACIFLAGCVMSESENSEGAGLANPAAVYCEQQGYTVEIREDPAGGQYGVCVFGDGTECDEWEFYKGECQPGEQQEADSPVHNSTPQTSQSDGVAIHAEPPEDEGSGGGGGGGGGAAPPETVCFSQGTVQASTANPKCLVIVDGQVYDLTTMKEHLWVFGGYMNPNDCGKDLSESVFKPDYTKSRITGYLVGNLC